MDGPAVSPDLAGYLERPLTPPAPEILAAIDAGPIDSGAALALTDSDRLLDPAPLQPETGWCWLPDGVGYVAVRTEMPGVTGEMLDWWFDWHADDPIRYRIWHPLAHIGNTIERPPQRRAKAHWGAVHHPVEDVGTGAVNARIEFHSPMEMGMTTDALADQNVATVVCGYAGDDTRRVRHTPMFHVVLKQPQGVVMRSRFWLGATLQPYGPAGPIARPIINRPVIRRAALPRELPRALATHCAEEYANLAALLPELWAAFSVE